MSFVSGVPSYSFLSEAEVSVTLRFSITSWPSSISNATFVKFVLMFVKSEAFNSMLYVPASVPFTSALPLNVKSVALYSELLILVTS